MSALALPLLATPSWTIGGIIFTLIGGLIIGLLGKLVAPGDRDSTHSGSRSCAAWLAC